MLTLYGAYRSRATRPIWLLNEIDLPFRHEPVIQSYRLANPLAADAPLNTASPSFLALNPQGQIPCMQDGDLVLTESLGMTLYLAKKYGGALGPADEAEEALMVQWMLQAVTGIEGPALETLYVFAEGRADTPEGQAVITAAAEKLRRPFKRLEGHLSANDWMVGGRFTVADINTAECARYAQPNTALMDEFPALKAWLARCQGRPAFKAMMVARNAEAA